MFGGPLLNHGWTYEGAETLINGYSNTTPSEHRWALLLFPRSLKHHPFLLTRPRKTHLKFLAYFVPFLAEDALSPLSCYSEVAAAVD